MDGSLSKDQHGVALLKFQSSVSRPVLVRSSGRQCERLARMWPIPKRRVPATGSNLRTLSVNSHSHSHVRTMHHCNPHASHSQFTLARSHTHTNRVPRHPGCRFRPA